MGMLMNRFNMLTQLRKDIRTSKVLGLNMNKFVLSGVVVHDPYDHELIDCMGRNFVKWAEMTGENFLFITFIHPSTNWKNSKYCHDGYWIDKDNLLTDATFSKEDEERTIPLLRNNMDLPESGSYLMLTENLCSNNFHKIQISAESIEEIFYLITKYCEEEYNGIEHTPADFNNLLRVLKAQDVSIMDSFLDVLIDFTSVTSYIVSNGEDMKEEQCEHAKKVINKLRAKMCNYIGDDFEDRLFNVFEFMKIAYTRQFPPKKTNSREVEERQEPEPLVRIMDGYSAKLYDSYSLLYSFVSRNQEEILDYSGLTIYLGKIVENELHLSVGQMLRWAMGIEMPTFYNKYCQGKSAIVQSGKMSVDLNVPMSPNECECPQKGISMGTMLIVYQNMTKHPDKITPQPDSDKIHKLDDKTYQFLEGFSQNYRNRASHLDSNSKKTYEGAIKAFNDFINNYLIQLYNIRQSILGSNH